MKILLLDSGIGLVPFIDQIIKMDKKNKYYLYMDKEFFPYGNKSIVDLRKRLIFLLKKFEKLNLDYLYICCNTLSNIYLRFKIKTKYKVKNILSLNLLHLHDNKILVTPSLKKLYQNDERFISSSLAFYIENYDIKNIISEIKRIKCQDKLILGCTHFPLVKNIFNHYLSNKVISYEKEFVAKICQGDEMIFYCREIEKEIIEKYFPFININLYSLS